MAAREVGRKGPARGPIAPLFGSAFPVTCSLPGIPVREGRGNDRKTAEIRGEPREQTPPEAQPQSSGRG